jgi:hypothetical protein
MFRKIRNIRIFTMFTLEVLTLLWAEPMRRTDLTSTLIFSLPYAYELSSSNKSNLKWAKTWKVIYISFSTLQKYKWVYNCLHAGYNFQHRIFEVPIYQCCQQCEFPDFSHCMRSGVVVQCNSEALRCIARCINNKGPTAGQPGPPGPPGPKKCPVKRKKVPGGSDCLERSCIHVWKSKVISYYEVRPKIWLKKHY